MSTFVFRTLTLFGIGAIIYLLWRLLKVSENARTEAPNKPTEQQSRNDPLNLAGLDERQSRFEHEIHMEERLGKR